MSLSKIKYVGYLIVFMLLLLPLAASPQSLEESLRAAQEGDVSTVRRLLERGNSPDTSDEFGNTLLIIASRQGYRELAVFLIGRKATVTHKNRFGDTALSMASLKGRLDVARLLLESGAEINPPGWTPLHYAAFEGHAEVVKLLLERGADKDAVAPNEYSALMLAARGHHLEAARAILHADPEVNFRSGIGESALKIATQKNFVPLIELLKRAGAVE